MHDECISRYCPDQSEAMSRLDLGPNKGPMDELHCRIETSFESLASFCRTWDDAVIRLGGSIYMSYDWCRIWWEFYAASRELRIFIFSVAEEVVGIVPLYIDSIGFWPFRFKVARLVGANIPPKVFDPPMNQAWAAQMFEHILTRLFGVDGCDLLSFGPVSELHQPSDTLAGVCTENGQLAAGCQMMSNGVHTVFSLPGSIGAFFDGLNKSERKKRQYESRLLRREFEVTEDVLNEAEKVAEEFDRFVAQHTAQWEAEGKPGHFGAWPRAKEFNSALVKAQGKLGRARINRIFANGCVVSSQYTFAFGETLFWELPSRVTGRAWDRYSLGSAGAITMIETAIQEGMKRVEGGLGDYDYKVKLGGKQHEVKTFRILANRPGSKIRLTVFNAFRLCVLYGYHKIWYRRISHRLPAVFRKPQWNFWLRLDF